VRVERTVPDTSPCAYKTLVCADTGSAGQFQQAGQGFFLFSDLPHGPCKSLGEAMSEGRKGLHESSGDRQLIPGRGVGKPSRAFEVAVSHEVECGAEQASDSQVFRSDIFDAAPVTHGAGEEAEVAGEAVAGGVFRGLSDQLPRIGETDSGCSGQLGEQSFEHGQ